MEISNEIKDLMFFVKQDKSFKKFMLENESDSKVEFDYSSFKEYQKAARKLTEITINKYKIFRSREYHVDHILSLYQGYKFKIPIELISSNINLQTIHYSENMKKNRHMTREGEDILDLFLNR